MNEEFNYSLFTRSTILGPITFNERMGFLKRPSSSNIVDDCGFNGAEIFCRRLEFSPSVASSEVAAGASGAFLARLLVNIRESGVGFLVGFSGLAEGILGRGFTSFRGVWRAGGVGKEDFEGEGAEVNGQSGDDAVNCLATKGACDFGTCALYEAEDSLSGLEPLLPRS